MKIEKDPAKVKALAREREEENWSFRRALNESSLPSERIDATVHEIYEEVVAEIDCRECGNCCRVISPVLEAEDIKRLAPVVGLSEDEFVVKYLKKDEGDLIFKEIQCPFLDGNLCTVYPDRPEDCASYPHLHKEGFVFRLMGVVSNCSVCPIVYNVCERLKYRIPGGWDPTPEDDLLRFS